MEIINLDNIISNLTKKCKNKPIIIYTDDINEDIKKINREGNQSYGLVSKTVLGIHYFCHKIGKSKILVKNTNKQIQSKLALIHELIHVIDSEEFNQIIDKQKVVKEYGEMEQIFYNAQKFFSEYKAFSYEKYLELMLSNDMSESHYNNELDDINYEVNLSTDTPNDTLYSLIRYYSKLTEINKYFNKKSSPIIDINMYRLIEEFIQHGIKCKNFDDYNGLAILYDKLCLNLAVKYKYNYFPR